MIRSLEHNDGQISSICETSCIHPSYLNHTLLIETASEMPTSLSLVYHIISWTSKKVLSSLETIVNRHLHYLDWVVPLPILRDRTHNRNKANMSQLLFPDACSPTPASCDWGYRMTVTDSYLLHPKQVHVWWTNACLVCDGDQVVRQQAFKPLLIIVQCLGLCLSSSTDCDRIAAQQLCRADE